MHIKDELKQVVTKDLSDTASAFFLRRALSRIDEAGPDKESLRDAAGKVVKMVRLFIDEQLAEEISGKLLLRIETRA